MNGGMLLSASLIYTASMAATTVSVDCTATPNALHTALATANANSNAGNLYTINISGTCFANAGAGTFSVTAPMTLQQDPSPAAVPAILDGGGAVPVMQTNATDVILRGLIIQNGVGIKSSFSSDIAGGITNKGKLRLEQSTVGNNKSVPGNGSGGGIVSVGPSASIVIDQSLVAGNTSDLAAGGILLFGGDALISRSTIYNNKAFGYGGGGIFIAEEMGLTKISQSTISGNSASQGGGIFISGFSRVTPVEINQSIVVNNIGQNPITKDIDTQDFPSNLITDPATNSVNDSNALLGSLANNGGPTQTLKPSAGSAAINGVSCTTTGNVDQRGAPRPGVGKTNCDVGAYETGNARLVLVAPSSGMLDFMTVTGPTTLPVMVQNTGNDIATFTGGTPSGTPVSSSARFVASAIAPADSSFPLIRPAGFQSFNVVYSPTGNTTDAGSLSIASNANALAVPMTGTGSGFTPPPTPGVAAILAYINQYSKTNPAQLYGLLKKPVLAALEVKAYSLVIAVAGQAINSGKINAACLLLRDAALTVDGNKKPLPDLLGGSAAPGLYAMIVQLRTSLGCTPI